MSEYQTVATARVAELAKLERRIAKLEAAAKTIVTEADRAWSASECPDFVVYISRGMIEELRKALEGKDD